MKKQAKKPPGKPAGKKKAPARAAHGCRLMQLPPEKLAEAAANAVAMNPANRVPEEAAAALMTALSAGDVADFLEPARLAFLTGKYWKPSGVRLGVRFMDNPTTAFRNKWLAHANAWGEFSNVSFAESSSGEVRVARGRGGYWSFLGTDILSIPSNEPTMNLEGFTERTDEAEWTRVVRHEVGHTLGCPHEHMRREVIALLDERKVIDYFRRTQGWGERTTRQQVLTPLEDSALIATPVADQTSIMTYQLPGSITKSGRPIPGGLDFSAMDREHAAKAYPRPDAPPPPPAGRRLVIEFSGDYRLDEA